jgi:hypothetical protein
MTDNHARTYTAGQLLRSNGRWSLTHLWLQSGGKVETTGKLETKCGWIYEADEVYDGPDVTEVWIAAPSLGASEAASRGVGRVSANRPQHNSLAVGK